MLRLSRRDFKRMFSPTSTFYKRLEKVAKERYDEIIQLTLSNVVDKTTSDIKQKGRAEPFIANKNMKINDDDKTD